MEARIVADQPELTIQPDADAIPVVLQAQKIRSAIPGGEVQFEIKMDAAIVDGAIRVTADVPEDTIEYQWDES